MKFEDQTILLFIILIANYVFTFGTLEWDYNKRWNYCSEELGADTATSGVFSYVHSSIMTYVHYLWFEFCTVVKLHLNCMLNHCVDLTADFSPQSILYYHWSIYILQKHREEIGYKDAELARRAAHILKLEVGGASYTLSTFCFWTQCVNSLTDCTLHTCTTHVIIPLLLYSIQELVHARDHVMQDHERSLGGASFTRLVGWSHWLCIDVMEDALFKFKLGVHQCT